MSDVALGQDVRMVHFVCDARVFEAASAHAQMRGITVSEVLRSGLQEYAQNPPMRAGSDLDEVKDGLRAVVVDGRGDLNSYMAALAAAGWSLALIAKAMVEAGLAETFTRQAVSLRVHKAPYPFPDDLPPVPARGIRRRSSVARFAFAGDHPRLPDEVHDFSYRVPNDVYGSAVERARKEGSMISQVQQNILERFAAGTFEPADSSSKE